MKKGFTIVELAIVVAAIAIVVAVLIPAFSSCFNSTKEKMIDVYNEDVKCQIYVGDELIFEGNTADFDSSGYELVSVEYVNSIVVMRMREVNTNIEE